MTWATISMELAKAHQYRDRPYLSTRYPTMGNANIDVKLGIAR
jgi:hypothetical protein